MRQKRFVIPALSAQSKATATDAFASQFRRAIKLARCAGAAQILVCLHQIGRMEMALITVIGASGRQGMAQVKQALAAGYDVRAISRQPEPFAGAKIEGIEHIEVRPMDLYDTATFKPALEGSDYIFYTHPLQARADRAVLIGDLGKVAAELDVKRVVWNTSSWIPDKPGDPFTYGENTKGINALWRSGAPGTVFGSVLFMDNLLTNWARPVSSADHPEPRRRHPDRACGQGRRRGAAWRCAGLPARHAIPQLGRRPARSDHRP